MQILNSIVPIFGVLFLGIIARKIRLIPADFIGPANRLTYYVAIPAMIFQAISKSDFSGDFNPLLVLGSVLPLLIVFVLFWGGCLIARIPAELKGTLIESAVHGNIGYVGLAVVYYHLGNDAFALAGILAGFLMVGHNTLAVVALQANSVQAGKRQPLTRLPFKILGNPIILTAALSILYSLFDIPLPVLLDRTLTIIGNLALPMGLLLIGASLSFRGKELKIRLVLFTSLVKLMALPGAGFLLYTAFHLAPKTYLPGLVLLSAPVATVTLILSTELGGNPKLASQTISVSTALSLATMTFWLIIVP